jgi:DNA-directed RNA polymerase II subunit RPB1
MNIFLAQSIQTQIELEEIADAKRQIISAAKSVTIYGIKQDGLIGSYNLTDDKTRINWRDAMNIVSYTTFDDFSRLTKDKEYTGAELFSMIIPPKVTMKIGETEIKDSNLVKGKISNSFLGAGKKNNLLHYIWDEYGEDATRNFIDNCQKLTNNFNLWNGFTVGVGDAIVSPATKKEIESYIEGVMNKVDVDITNIENNPSYMNVETFENKLRADINVVRDDVSKIVMGSVPSTNNFGIMSNSGSKGGANNLGQMIGCVGFQDFEGALMPKIYYDRTMCYFHENDDRPKSRGLCHNSYMDGLSYSEFCYHTKAGRAGLVTQVVKTSETGYAQRKLVKTMEDVMVKYDGTVRIANNQIIQMTYGGNGNDTTMQYDYKINMIEMNNEALENNFKLSKDELKEFTDFSAKDNEEHFHHIKTLRDLVRENTVKSKLNYMTVTNSYMLPLNLTRIISSMVSSSNKLSDKSNDKSKSNKVSPKYIIESIEDFLSIKETPLVRIPQSMEKNPPRVAVEDDYIAKTMLRVALYDSLSPKIVNNKYKLSKETFDEIMEEIKTSFHSNIIEPGEMVGIIAAESLGEAVTQMTISSFHHTGIASLAHSTSGVPRINELISATKNPKTPQMFIYLNDASKGSREIAHKIGSYLEKTTLGSIMKQIEVYYDPNPTEKGGIMEADGVKEAYYSKKLTRNSCQANIENLPWLFRIQIDKEKMLEKDVTLLDIKNKFCVWWDRRHINTKKKKEKITTLKKITSFAMLSNSDNDLQPIVHVRFNVKDLDKAEGKTKSKAALEFNRQTLIDFIDMLDKFKLKGIEGVDAINAVGKERYMDATDGDGMKVGEEHVIYTSGTNMKEIRYINGIDPYRTYTDDVTEIFTTFGIEFARNRLLGEFLKAYENAGNSGINPQHIAVLVDIMCYGGSVISADRHGMKKADIDPLTKASFEKSIDVLVSAAVFGDVDKMRGVSSRLYIGSVFRGGTGYCELVLDTKKIQNSEYIEKETRSTKNNISINTIAASIMEDDGDKGEAIYIPGEM